MSSNNFYLFDAALLKDVEFVSLAEIKGAQFLYADLGESALRFGPALIEQTDATARFVEEIESDGEPRYVVSRLQAHRAAPLSIHLLALRYVIGPNGRQYFFRFADTRALVAMYEAICPAKRAALTGPINRWSFQDRKGISTSLSHGGEIKSASLPLTLDSKEMKVLLDRTRPDELLDELYEIEPQLKERSNGWQRYDVAVATCHFLKTQRLNRQPLRLAVGLVAQRTSGQALDDPGFMQCVEQASRCVDIAPVLDWRPGTAGLQP